MQQTLSGLILRQRPQDDDRVIHLLTREMGLISAYAKGARRPRSPLAAGTEALCYSRVVLFKSKSWYYVDAAEVIDGFFALRKNITGLSLAAYIAELGENLAPEQTEAGDYLRLLLNALHLLRGEEKDERLIKAAVELRLLTLSGYMPDMVACDGCGLYDAPGFYFLLQSGEIICADCAPQPPSGAIWLRSPVVAAMRHILYAAAEDLFAFSLGEQSLRELSAASEAYLTAQIERRLPTLDFYSSLNIPL